MKRKGSGQTPVAVAIEGFFELLPWLGGPTEIHLRSEHGLTFPIVLQQQWEVSRRYAMFATPIAYLIDEHGIISHDVAVGVESILALMASLAARKEMEPLLTA